MEEVLSLDTTAVSLLVKVGPGNLTSSVCCYGLATPYLKANTLEISVGLKETSALFMRSSTWGEDKFMSRNQLWRFCLTMKAFKGRVMWEGHQKHLLFSLSVVSSSLRPMEACQAFMPFIFSFRLLRLMSIESMMPSNHPILCHPLFLLPSIFSRIRVFPMNWLFASGGQSIGVSASASILPRNIQDWFPLGWTGWISLLSKGLKSSPAPQYKSINSSVLSLLFGPTLPSVHDY